MNPLILKQFSMSSLDKLAFQLTNDQQVITVKDLVEYVYFGYGAEKFTLTREQVLDEFQSTIVKFVKSIIHLQGAATISVEDQSKLARSYASMSILYTLNSYLEDNTIDITETASALPGLSIMFDNFQRQDLIFQLYNLGYEVVLTHREKQNPPEQ